MTRHSYTNIGTKSTAKVFLDTNVALDLAIRRQPFYRESVFVEQLARMGSLQLQISEGTLVTMIYLAYERYKLPDADGLLKDFVDGCQIFNAGKPIIQHALNSPFRDKEDAYQYYTAIESNADYFLTRDNNDFMSVVPYVLPVLSPLQFEYMLL